MKTWKEVRNDMGYKSYEMAKLLNISNSSYSRKENGERNMKLTEATLIARKYFEITGQFLDITLIK